MFLNDIKIGILNCMLGAFNDGSALSVIQVFGYVLAASKRVTNEINVRHSETF